MDCINFIWKGVSGFREYDRDYYPMDSVPRLLEENEKSAPSDNIDIVSDDGKTKVLRLWNTYQMTTASDQIKDRSVKMWKKLRDQTRIINTLTLFGSFGGLIAAMSISLMPVVISVALASAAIFGFHFFLIRPRLDETIEELRKWDETTIRLLKLEIEHQKSETDALEQQCTTVETELSHIEGQFFEQICRIRELQEKNEELG